MSTWLLHIALRIRISNLTRKQHNRHLVAVPFATAARFSRQKMECNAADNVWKNLSVLRVGVDVPDQRFSMLEIDHHIYVAGTGSYLPERVVSNATLEGLISNYDKESGDFCDWVERMTHIQERRMLDMDASAGDMAREASLRALQAAKIDPTDIDIVLMATFTTKNVYPGEQTKLVRDLEIHGGNAPTFYLTAGCAGAVYGLQTAYAFLKAGIYRHALVIGTEHLTSVMDFSDPLTAILFGDGAGAVVLSRRDEPGPGGVGTNCVLGSKYVADNITMDNNNSPPRHRMLTIDGDEGPREMIVRQYVKMGGGPRVLRAAVNAMSEATVKSLGFTMKDLKAGNDKLRSLLNRVKLVPHQANGRIIDGLRDKLGLNDDQVYKTIYRYGNMSCASNVVTLDYALRRGSMTRVVQDGLPAEIREDDSLRIKPGDLVAVPAVGAGYLTGCFTFVHE